MGGFSLVPRPGIAHGIHLGNGRYSVGAWRMAHGAWRMSVAVGGADDQDWKEIAT
jgi:hypothetical protein